MLLETRRLLLREFKREDWPAVQEWASDPDVSRFMTWGPNSDKQTIDYVEQVVGWRSERPRRMYELAVVQREERKLIGACALRLTKPEHMAAEIAYCFHRQYWLKGYASEASHRLLQYGFENLEMHRIYGLCDVDNRGSQMVMVKLGMKEEGRLRHYNLVKGRWRDFYIYSILVDEWDSRNRVTGGDA